MIKVENTKGRSIISIVPNNPDDPEEIVKENTAEIISAFAAIMTTFVEKVFMPGTPDEIKKDMIYEISSKSMQHALKRYRNEEQSR